MRNALVLLCLWVCLCHGALPAFTCHCTLCACAARVLEDVVSMFNTMPYEHDYWVEKGWVGASLPCVYCRWHDGRTIACLGGCCGKGGMHGYLLAVTSLCVMMRRRSGGGHHTR